MIQGTNVELMYHDLVITHDTSVRSTTVHVPEKVDVLGQYTYSGLHLTGDLRTVLSLSTLLTQILNTISRISHLSSQLRTELSLIKAKHPMTITLTQSSLVVNLSLLLISARTKFCLTFTLPPNFLQTGKGIQVSVERVYGDVDINEVRRTVESRVRDAGIGCMKGTCDEVLEVWE